MRMRLISTLAVCCVGFCETLSPAEQPDEPKLPHWIWSEAADRDEFALHHSFEIVSAVHEAELMLAADFAACSVRINGRPAGRLDNFGPLLEADITGLLKQGRNEIRLVCMPAEGPSAVALSVDVSAASTQQRIVSDATWTVTDGVTGESGRVKDMGQVAAQFWISRQQSRVSTFDDYTQWKQAQTENAEEGNSPTISALPGFEVELIRQAEAEEGSWVSLAIDPQGRLTIAREDQGLLRLTISPDDGSQTMETINDTLKECRGLLYAYGALYANANNSKGLYRLSPDADNPDSFNKVELLREFPGGVGHGRNDLAFGPDDRIYSIHGDSVNLPQSNITDLTSPFRDGANRGPQAQGHLVSCDKDGRDWQLVATGLRNPFGIDFNTHGDVFTYDADAEFDMGAPWYRPTRLDHLVPGADFGWRGLTGKWPPYDLDHADNALPVATIGKGSPTAVKFGDSSNFPPPWKQALFILDWAYGRIVACHLYPRGAGYTARSQVFLQGRPLNVTDLDFGPDGDMYFVTGGRKTESSLYRVRWTGIHEADDASAHQVRRASWSAEQRTRRRTLSRLLAADSDSDATIDAAWSFLSSDDPMLRHTAQTVIEHQPVSAWSERAIAEQHPATAACALLALSRSLASAANSNGAAGEIRARRNRIIMSLNALPVEKLSAYNKLAALRSWELCLASGEAVDPAVLVTAATQLKVWLHEAALSDAPQEAPTGAGDSVVARLSRIVMLLSPADANPDVVDLLARATSQQDRLRYLFLLRTADKLWTPDARRLYFDSLNELETSFLGGDGMPRFLKKIREEAVKTLSDDEKTHLGTLIQAPTGPQNSVLTIQRSHVRDWTLDDVPSLLQTSAARSGSVENGRRLFSEALCSRCHRAGRSGGVFGPDLTSVGNRFSRRDLLKSIIAPSDVVSEKYRNVTVVTSNGKTVTGRPLSSGDYRSPSVRIATDPLNPAEVVEILKSDIEERQPSKASPMPKGLLSSLTADEISDLLTFLISASELP